MAVNPKAIDQYLPKDEFHTTCRFCLEPVEILPNVAHSQIWTISFITCPSCGFVSAWPYGFDHPYHYKNNHHMILVDPQWSDFEYLKTTANYNRELIVAELENLPEKSHFEIGCFSGFMLANLQPHFDHLEGVELNTWAVNEGRKRGLTIHHSPIQTFKPTRKFGSIQSREVIEHLWDFHSHMRLCNQLAMPGTLLHIQTPIPCGDLNQTTSYQPYHLSLFTEANLRSILEFYDWEVESIRNLDRCGIAKAWKE
jgi:hypothetical protein